MGEQIATNMCIQLTCTHGYLYAFVFIKVCVDCADTHISYWYNLDMSNTWHIFYILDRYIDLDCHLYRDNIFYFSPPTPISEVKCQVQHQNISRAVFFCE